jgi:hypothetical protein
MIRKNGPRFSEKIMLRQKARATGPADQASAAVAMTARADAYFPTIGTPA